MSEPLSDDVTDALADFALTDLYLSDAEESNLKPFKHDRDSWRDPEEDDKNFDAMPKAVVVTG
jgi:hypothetical protein